MPITSSDLPDKLKEAAKRRSLLPFIGAGFSRNIDKNMPTWDKLIDNMAVRLDFDPEILRLHGDHLQIAEFMEQSGKLKPFYNDTSKAIDDTGKFRVEDSPPHLLLPYLDVSTIYTTNWDGWIERGFTAEGVAYNKIVNVDHLTTPDRNTAKTINTPNRKLFGAYPRSHPVTSIIKFHGDFDYQDTIVVRETHYFKRLALEEPMDLKLYFSALSFRKMFGRVNSSC